MFFLSEAILILTFGAQILLRSFSNGVIINNANQTRIYKFIRILSKIRIFVITFYFSIFAVFSFLIYYSYQQYIVWLRGEPSKYMLPPYQSINYFLYYVTMRFFALYIFSLLASILFLFIAKIFNKKYEERFFEPEEIYLGALALFLIGWPGLMFYFIGLILIYLVIHLLSFIISRKPLVISLYYWWIPLAIFVIILNNWLIKFSLWKLLKI